jgi:multisubunit Na+/H+ antiporter MnhF subunit
MLQHLGDIAIMLALVGAISAVLFALHYIEQRLDD